MQRVRKRYKEKVFVKKMLQPKVLPKIIDQLNTNGIQTTILLNIDGSLLSSTGDTKDNKDTLIAAIVANIWRTYSKKGKKGHSAFIQNQKELIEPLECLIIDSQVLYFVVHAFQSLQ